MTETRIDELMEKAESKFALVIGASKRTRQITDFLNARNPGEAADEGAVPPPVSELMIKKPLMIALDEIADGKVDIVHIPVGPDEIDTPEADAMADAAAILGVKAPEETMDEGEPQEPVEEAAVKELAEADAEATQDES
jgi:DNA-directed RNA polymerase subunit omega